MGYLDRFAIDGVGVPASTNLDVFYGDGSDGVLGFTDNAKTIIANLNIETPIYSGNKLIRMSNGWLIQGMHSASTLYVYVSKDNGATWAQFYTETIANWEWHGMCFATKDMNVYMLVVGVANGSTGYISPKKADMSVTSPTFTDMYGFPTIGSVKGCFCSIDGNGTIHLAWCGMTSTYPLTHNLIYAKSTDGGATFSTPAFLTNVNIGSFDYLSPYIMLRNNIPFIFFSSGGSNSSYQRIFCFRYNGTGWTGTVVSEINSTSLFKHTPYAIVDGNNNIHVAWRELITTDANYIIKYSMSTDSGATWSTPTQISASGYNNISVNITRDNNNDVYVVYCGYSSTYGSTLNMMYKKKTSGTWGSEQFITTTGGKFEATVQNYNDFTKPLITYFDSSSYNWTFYGEWIDNNVTYTRTEAIISGNIDSVLNGGVVVKQYKSINIPSGTTITVSNPCQGLILYSQGDVIIDGTIDMSKKAGIAPNGNVIPMLIQKNFNTTNAKISSLLHFNNNIVDDTGRVWTNNGATFDTTNKKFGSASLSIQSSQCLTTPCSSGFHLENKDFTMELWVRFSVLNTTVTVLGMIDSHSTSHGYAIYKNSNNTISFCISSTGGTLDYVVESNTNISDNNFHHLAVVRDGKYLKIFIDGNFEKSLYCGDIVFNSSTSDFVIGKNGDYNDYYMQGQLDEFCLIKGLAKYKSSFSVQTSEYSYQILSNEVDSYNNSNSNTLKFYQLTSSLQTLKGGAGGNGGIGGNGTTGTSSYYGCSGGTGGTGRQNLGGFGAGGGCGAADSVTSIGNDELGRGGSILFSEVGGGENLFTQRTINDYASMGACFSKGFNGAGGLFCTLSTQSNVYNLSLRGGKCFGGGGGGAVGYVNSTYMYNGNDGEYAGGFIAIICGGNIIIGSSGYIKANGGNGGAGGGSTSGTVIIGSGGGGGSGGGVVALYYGGNYTNNGTIQVNGGTGGAAGGTSWSGTVWQYPTAGASGSAGTVFSQKLS